MNNTLDELNTYIDTVLNTMCRGVPYEAILSNSVLMALGDDTILCATKLDNIPNNIRYNVNKSAFEYIEITDMYNKIYSAYKSMMIESESPIIYHNDNLKDDPKFVDILDRNADDGADFYTVDAMGIKIFIPVMKGFPNISKPDKIGLTLYDIGNNMTMVKYDILKKKLNINYSIYFNILNLSGRQ